MRGRGSEAGSVEARTQIEGQVELLEGGVDIE